MDIVVDYELALKNNVGKDAERAIKLLLEGNEGTVLTIYPQALNPLLKALESLSGLWRQILVMPYQDSTNRKTIYIVLKVGQGEVESVKVGSNN